MGASHYDDQQPATMGAFSVSLAVKNLQAWGRSMKSSRSTSSVATPQNG
jgi:hypothetical protein